MKFAENMLRLYAVTDRSWVEKQSLYQQVESALKGGATMVQLREKDADYETFYAEAITLRTLCQRYKVPFIVNDNVELALKVDADGVHVGQEDMDAQNVRTLIGPDRILGVTAKTVEQAIRAQQAGADYLGSGAVFGSATKTNTKSMSLELLKQITNSVTIPVVAIGGITLSNITLLAETDIRGAAVVSGIFSAADIEAECRLLKTAIEKIVR